MTTALEAEASMMSDSLMPPTPAKMTSTLTSGWVMLRSDSSEGLHRAAHVALDDEGQFLDPALLEAAVELVEAAAPPRLLASCSRRRRAVRCSAFCRASRSSSTTMTKSPATGRVLKPSTCAGTDGVGLGDGHAGEVEHGLDLAVRFAADEGVAHVQGAALHQDGGHRAATHVQLGLDDHAGGRRLGVGLEFLHLGHQQDHVHELVEVQSSSWRRLPP